MSCNSFWILLDAMTLLAPERGDGERERCPLSARVPPSLLPPTPGARTPPTPRGAHGSGHLGLRQPAFRGLRLKQRTLDNPLLIVQ